MSGSGLRILIAPAGPWRRAQKAGRVPGGGSVMRIARQEEVSHQVTEKQSPSCWGAEHVRWRRRTRQAGASEELRQRHVWDGSGKAMRSRDRHVTK